MEGALFIELSSLIDIEIIYIFFGSYTEVGMENCRGVLLFDQDDNIYSVQFMRRCFRNVLFQYAKNCMQLLL